MILQYLTIGGAAQWKDAKYWCGCMRQKQHQPSNLLLTHQRMHPTTSGCRLPHTVFHCAVPKASVKRAVTCSGSATTSRSSNNYAREAPQSGTRAALIGSVNGKAQGTPTKDVRTLLEHAWSNALLGTAGRFGYQLVWMRLAIGAVGKRCQRRIAVQSNAALSPSPQTLS